MDHFNQSCLNISDITDIKADPESVKSDSRRLSRYEGDSDRTGWLKRKSISER